ncbi:MAG TPA: glycosyltransferase family 4 protein [Fibrobacteria bacterium]|nr:glycosyltransferase family 4 protein [Fibrobacteria bacterium]
MAQMMAYLIHTFPQYSSTFINDEVDEMRRQGAELALFAVQKPGAKEYPSAFERFVRETRYIFPIRKGPFFARHLKVLAQKPWSYLSCIAWILAKRGLGIRNRVRTLYHFAEAVYIHPEIRERGCRHVHAHFLFGGASVAYFLNRIHGMSYSLTAHGSDIFVDRVLHAEKLGHARFTRLATEYNAAFLRPKIPAPLRHTLHVIPFGIDRNRIPPAEGRNPARHASFSGRSPLRLLSVGRLIWQKAQHLLLEACSQAARSGFEFHLRLVGEGPLRSDLEAQIRTLGLETRVTLVGAIPQDEVWLEYRRADIFLLTSVSEGSPFVILEALACGLPVIAPALHGIPEMIRDGVDGRLFQTGSALSLTEAMGELMGNDTLRKRFGIEAETAAAHFDLVRSVSLFRKLFEAPNRPHLAFAGRETEVSA